MIKKENLKQTLNHREVGILSSGKIRHFSVLVPLIKTQEGYSVLFERRSSNIPQGNDVCFPGGKVEENESYLDCALRETSEELLIDEHQIEILGPLDLYIGSDTLIIHPFLGILHDYDFTYSTNEVSEIYIISLEELLNHVPENYKGKLLLQLEDNFPYSKIEGGESYAWRQHSHQILFYNLSQMTLWGMSARILKGALDLIRNSD